jgi:hypothetical protein
MRRLTRERRRRKKTGRKKRYSIKAVGVGSKINTRFYLRKHTAHAGKERKHVHSSPYRREQRE